jgi:hypothetical protein
MLEFPFFYCQLCQITLPHLYNWGNLELQNGKIENLERVCIKCYEALMNDTMINTKTCDKCDSDCLTLMRENYNVQLAKKRIFRNFREYIKCEDCENTFILEEQTRMENYRKSLAKNTPVNKKFPMVDF